MCAGLPGLVVDRYGDVLVVQAHTGGLDAHMNAVVDALASVFKYIHRFLPYEFLSSALYLESFRCLPFCSPCISSFSVRPRAIVERSDVTAREHEGSKPRIEVRWGTLDAPVAIEENGVRYAVDVVAGQKTGFYYDQRDARAFVQATVRRLVTPSVCLIPPCFALCDPGSF